MHLPVVTFLTEDDNKLLEQLKTGFKWITKWNECKSEMTTQAKANSLNDLIDSTFGKVNW